MKILLVEPDTASQEQLSAQLRAWGHSVATARDADEALAALASTATELVLGCGDVPAEPSLCARIRSANELAQPYVLLFFREPTALRTATAEDADDLFLLSPDGAGDELRLRLRAAARFLRQQQAYAEQHQRLRELVEGLGSSLNTLQGDLRAASEVQLGLLPSESAVHPAVEVDWLVLPSSFLCGDNLNYFVVQDRYLVFYHLDVAGHGIPSALLSVTLNQLLSPQPGSPMMRFDSQLDLKRLIPPAEVVRELNSRFLPQGDSYFTLIYGIFDTVTRDVCMCQAGHPSPLRLLPSGEITSIGEGGFPVGLWPDMTYDEISTTLAPGEKLVLYSDGLLGSPDPEGAPYSLDHFQQLLREHAPLRPGELLQAVQSDLEAWTQGRTPPDDVSILILECKAT